MVWGHVVVVQERGLVVLGGRGLMVLQLVVEATV